MQAYCLQLHSTNMTKSAHLLDSPKRISRTSSFKAKATGPRYISLKGNDDSPTLVISPGDVFADSDVEDVIIDEDPEPSPEPTVTAESTRASLSANDSDEGLASKDLNNYLAGLSYPDAHDPYTPSVPAKSPSNSPVTKKKQASRSCLSYHSEASRCQSCLDYRSPPQLQQVKSPITLQRRHLENLV